MLARRFLTATAAKKLFPKAFPGTSTRFSTLLNQKENAEEAQYIKQLEAKRQEELRQSIDRILSLEDSQREKQELVDLLGKYDYSFSSNL
jgi:hypothetical protein